MVIEYPRVICYLHCQVEVLPRFIYNCAFRLMGMMDSFDCNLKFSFLNELNSMAHVSRISIWRTFWFE